MLRHYRGKREELMIRRADQKLMTKMEKLEFQLQAQNELAHLSETKDSREFWKRVS